MVLPRAFYQRETRRVAHDLLGKCLVRRTPQGATTGRIVEVEAYLPKGDPACHAARGRTRTNVAMFGAAGHAYVYPIHARYCFNTVTQSRRQACGVLIRAVEPLEGLPLMQQRRGDVRLLDLARGPARLCQAFAIDRRLDRWDLTRGRRLWIEELADPPRCWQVSRSERIGVTSAHHLPLRYFYHDCPFVSGPRRLNKLNKAPPACHA